MEYEAGILKKFMVTYTTFDLSEFSIGSQVKKNFAVSTALKHIIGYATSFFTQDKNIFQCKNLQPFNCS